MKTLPKSWCVRCTEENQKEFSKTVLKYLNDKYNKDYEWSDGYYYGINAHGGVDWWHNAKSFGTILTLEQFKQMAMEFKRGDKVMVSADGTDWHKEIYLTTIEGAEYPFICVSSTCEEEFNKGEKFYIDFWEHIKPVEEEKLTIKVELNGKEVHPSEISEETWKNLRK